MREIKFRAWDGEEMVIPDYIDQIGSGWWKSNSIPNTSKNLMQYTGLKDKNGKEIYEGDIVTQRYTGTWEVVYGASRFYLRRYDNPVNDTFPYRRNSDILPLEVIGNIYENPELLTNANADSGEAAPTTNQ